MGEHILYTALGDSISGGFGARITCGFAYRFCDYLTCKYCSVKCRNLACPGLTSCGLLQQLRKDPEVRCCVKAADVITISIGGDNLLKCTCDNYRTICRKSAEKWVGRFREDWPRILDCIRRGLCSQAQLYVMTLYNPYHHCDCNYELADYYIRQINSIIADPILVQTYNYVVVDVYTCFESNRCKDWTFFSDCLLRDPHPNCEGQRQIYCMFKKAYNENNFVS
jgi:lysophospholipase L1-like esterase